MIVSSHALFSCLPSHLISYIFSLTLFSLIPQHSYGITALASENVGNANFGVGKDSTMCYVSIAGTGDLDDLWQDLDYAPVQWMDVTYTYTVQSLSLSLLSADVNMKLLLLFYDLLLRFSYII